MTTHLALALAAALAASSTAYAQTVEANIPFPFTVGKTALPAGKTTFDLQVAQGVLRVRSADYKTAAMVITNGVTAKRNADGKATIVFNRYGDACFLSQFHYPGYDGRALPKSVREIELAAGMPAKVEALVARK